MGNFYRSKKGKKLTCFIFIRIDCLRQAKPKTPTRGDDGQAK